MVCRETTSISDWSFLASLIGVTDYERIAMDNSTVQEKQRAIIRAWLNSGKASWAVLIHALRDPLVGKAAVAEQIACKYASKFACNSVFAFNYIAKFSIIMKVAVENRICLYSLISLLF